jgi:hypothetical protein
VTAEAFDPGWLALREPADARARSAALAVELAGSVPASPVVHDLGSGTGSMVRWLAPYLPGRPRWVLHDRDPALLARAGAAVEPRVTDLAALTPADLAGADVVTASALLDVLTADEVDAVAAACAQRRVPALLALTVLGGVRLDPPDPLDDVVAAAFDAHQRRPVGGRRLLGPDAVGAGVRAFVTRGAAVDVRPSPWLLGPDDTALLVAWLHGWVGAAREQVREPAFDGYLRRRLAVAREGRLRVEVQHADLLVRWPEPVAQEDDVVDRADLEELGARVARGEAPVAGEPGRGRVAEEERRDDEVQLVDQPGAEEGRLDRGATLDQQPVDTPSRQIGEQRRQRDRVAGVHDLRPGAEPRPQGGDRRAGRVDDALGVPGLEEGGRGVEVTGPRDGHLGRGGREPAGDPGRAPLAGADEEARIVGADGPGADQDRVTRGAHVVDPVEVVCGGEDETLGGGVVEVSVQRGRAAQHHERAAVFAHSDRTRSRDREEAGHTPRW